MAVALLENHSKQKQQHQQKQQQQQISDLLSFVIALLKDPNPPPPQREQPQQKNPPRLLGCGEQSSRYEVLRCCFGGRSVFAGLLEIIMGYYSTHCPLPKYLYFQGVVGPTQEDAARWFSNDVMAIQDAGRFKGAREWLQSAVDHARELQSAVDRKRHLFIEENEKIEEQLSKKVAVVPIQYPADWAQRAMQALELYHGDLGGPDRYEYCKGLYMSLDWILPVCGPDGTVESLMSNVDRANRLFVTDYSQNLLELPAKRWRDCPKRVIRLHNPEMPGEMIFVLLYHGYIVEDQVIRAWDENVAPMPVGYVATCTTGGCALDALNSIGYKLFRYDEISSHEFIIDMKSMPGEVLVYRYCFCNQSGRMQLKRVHFEDHQFPGGDLGRYCAAYHDTNLTFERLHAWAVGSTLYTCVNTGHEYLVSWDISLQSFREHKFGQVLGVHFLDTAVQIASVCEIDGGRLICADVSSQVGWMKVFGPIPSVASTTIPTTCKNEGEEKPQEPPVKRIRLLENV